MLAIRMRSDDIPSKMSQIERIRSLWIPQIRASNVCSAQMHNCVTP